MLFFPESDNFTSQYCEKLLTSSEKDQVFLSIYIFKAAVGVQAPLSARHIAQTMK